MTPDRKAAAERFFRGVYGGDPSVVDELASDDVLVSYPIFTTLFDTPVIRGRQRVRDFAAEFGERWKDARFNIHECVEERNCVILLWSFSARNTGPGPGSTPPTNQVHSWGGITLYRFDDEGKIAAEIGEESTPGPMARVEG